MRSRSRERVQADSVARQRWVRMQRMSRLTKNGRISLESPSMEVDVNAVRDNLCASYPLRESKSADDTAGKSGYRKTRDNHVYCTQLICSGIYSLSAKRSVLVCSCNWLKAIYAEATTYNIAPVTFCDLPTFKFGVCKGPLTIFQLVHQRCVSLRNGHLAPAQVSLGFTLVGGGLLLAMVGGSSLRPHILTHISTKAVKITLQ
ncbi:hypothetical protein C8Q78DRAFT_783022 [Trametes maxima]|nr:hypothetical protein C8Q78DRAFT_783022 [Trametes maxima]